jgi:asparagine synthase (glutamine-hydrolysing)
VGDPALLLTSIISESSAGRTGVLISGAGADEYLAGYHRHKAFFYYLKYRRLFNLIARNKNRILTAIPSHGSDRIRLIRKLITDLDYDPAVTIDNFMSHRDLTDTTQKQGEPDSGEFISSKSALLYAALERDRHEYLINDILLMSDQVSMFHGVEIRSPYLDNSLTNFIRSIPVEMIFRHGQKWILRKLLQRYGLSFISRRTKMGFGFPFGRWIRESPFRYMTEKLLHKKNPVFDYIDYNRTSEVIVNHLGGRKDHSAAIFSLLILSGWMENN